MIHGKPGLTAMVICLRFTGSLREPHVCLCTKPAEMIQFVWPHDHYSKQTRLVRKKNCLIKFVERKQSRIFLLEYSLLTDPSIRWTRGVSPNPAVFLVILL